MDTQFRCSHCGKQFQRESWFKKHTCDKAERFAQRHNMDVIVAFKLYAHWCKREGFNLRGKDRQYDEFLKSPYYPIFVGLVEFTKRNYVISPFLYLDWLIDCNTKSPKWTLPATLSIYRKHVRQSDNPTKHVEVTLQSVRKYCEENELPMNQFFEQVTPKDGLKMIIAGEIMPWVAFGYDVATEKLLGRFDDEKLLILQEKINADHWIAKVQEQVDEKALVMDLCVRHFGE